MWSSWEINKVSSDRSVVETIFSRVSTREWSFDTFFLFVHFTTRYTANLQEPKGHILVDLQNNFTLCGVYHIYQKKGILRTCGVPSVDITNNSRLERIMERDIWWVGRLWRKSEHLRRRGIRKISLEIMKLLIMVIC